jgi:hypothetical protein
MPGKFNNIKVKIDGMTFDSKREGARYVHLKMLQKAGHIRDLRTKVPACRFPLRVNNELICTYIADFLYYDVREQQDVVEDTKGFRTREYVIKRKLMHAIHGITIRET